MLSVGLVVAVMVIKVQQANSRVRARLEQKLAALKASGMPTTAADLAQRFPDPSDAEDAALLLQDALSLLVAPTNGHIPFLSGELPRGTNRMNAEMTKALAQLAQDNQDALKALPNEWPANARFAAGFANGFPLNQSMNLVQLRRLEQTLAAIAVYQAEQGDATEATHNLAQCLRVSLTVKPYSLLNYMVQRACQSLSSTRWNGVLIKPTLLIRTCTLLNQPLAAAITNEIGTVMIAELCQSIWGFELGRNSPMSSHFGAPGQSTPLAVLREVLGLDPPIYSDAGYLQYLEWMEMCLASAGAPYRTQINKCNPWSRDALAVAYVCWRNP